MATTADFEMKAHDRLPSIQATLSADLTTATAVKFLMYPATDDWQMKPAATIAVNAAATIVTAAAGVVRYDWLAIDTSVPGQYIAEWEVMWPSSKAQTFPTKTYHTILIRADLNNA